MATLGVLLSTAVVYLLCVCLPGWDWRAASTTLTSETGASHTLAA